MGSSSLWCRWGPSAHSTSDIPKKDTLSHSVPQTFWLRTLIQLISTGFFLDPLPIYFVLNFIESSSFYQLAL